MTDLVPNPYLAAIRYRRGLAVPVAAELRDALDAAVRAMERGAWVSSRADDFATDLAGHREALGRAADGVLGTYDDAIGRQPEEVEPTAWQVRWRNLR